jgi:outer membrane protein OmpA-like peptidoglycan-associated protein
MGWVMRRNISFWPFWLSLLTTLLLASRARAQGVVAERFHPAATAGGYVTTERPETAGPWRVGGGLTFSYARSPLYLVVGPYAVPLIDHTLSVHAQLSLGILRFLEVGLSLPATLYQQGVGVGAPAALRDIALLFKGRLFTHRHAGLGLLGTLAVPSGDSQGYSGTGQVSFAARLLFEARVDWLRTGLNAGVLLRQPGQAGTLPLSHELTYSAALGLSPHRMIELLGEIHGSTSLLSPWQTPHDSPLEAALAAALRVRGFSLMPGAGVGLVGGIGAPAYRVFFSLGYRQPMKPAPVVAGRLPAAPPPPAPPPLRPMELAPPEPETESEPTTVYRGTAEIVVTDTELIPQKAIYFDVNRARVQSDFAPVLDALAGVLAAHPELGAIRIEGHTDGTGAPRYNRELSLKRAQTVREALIQRGIAARRLIAVGYGSLQPIGDNTDPQGRSQNRRVVFHHEGRPPVRKTAAR